MGIKGSWVAANGAVFGVGLGALRARRAAASSISRCRWCQRGRASMSFV